MAVPYRHIFLRDTGESASFTTPSRNFSGTQNIPQRNRQEHSERLQEQLNSIWSTPRDAADVRTAVSMSTKDGVYIEFEGAPDFGLLTKSLEDRRAGIRLLHIYTFPSEISSEQKVTRATVFIPNGKQDYFLKKIQKYAQEETPNGVPKNANLVQSIENIRLAVLESFWSDNYDLLPQGVNSVWCEIWLRGTGDPVEQRFREIARELGIEVQPRSLRFPERIVILGKVTREQLVASLEYSADIAEFRRAKETARFFLELGNRDQTEWVDELRSRLQVNPEPSVAVCVLDSGANNGHALLMPILADSDCHSVEMEWGVNDRDGHGTLMSGIAAYGDLLDSLQHNNPIVVNHCLETTKILPPDGNNDPALYGDITLQGISRAEISAPSRIHIGCMAVTSEDGREHGRPTSWSAAIDQLTSGYDDDVKRLFVVSAGNIMDADKWSRYPQSNLEYSIHDPAQSWNALTVGAFTEKSILTDSNLQCHIPLAMPSELSPFSSTSLVWETKWPVKPDVVLEGGNLAKGPDDYISQHDDLSSLSTGHQPTRRQFDVINATSAAAAKAAWMAAEIQSRYPAAWPETVRGLLIHSAEWPDAMKMQFLVANSSGEYSKTQYGKLLRICGYGVPTLSKALSSAANSLTLIAQEELQPYAMRNNRLSTNEMHLHRLPWPREVLLGLGEMPVELRITLSYFIEPAPGEVGWKDKYRYASHGLRFDLNNMGETEERFVGRLNAAARDEGERSDSNSGSERWLIGANSRNSGSVHSDIWKGSAADIASCNLIGIYPIIGWWRDRSWLGRCNRKARYSLIVSLHTPDESIDIYTPVAVHIGVPVMV